MLTIASAMSAADAAAYHGKEGLEAEGGSRGAAGGRGSGLLGLLGSPTAEVVKALIRNRTPQGERLTQRDRKDKKPLTDFCFSPCKPVAILHQVGGDRRIPGEVMAAAMDTARTMEKRTICRVKVFKKYREHTTGIAVILPDYHLRTRPVDGVSDPGDHVHVKFMNVTWHEGKRYSAEFDAVVRDKKLYRDMFHANLRGRMERLGYGTYKDGFSFGVEGVTPAMVAKFSNRTAGIDKEQARREAAVQARIDAERHPEAIARLRVKLARVKAPKARAALGAKIRELKSADLMTDKLFEEWLRRLTPDEARRLGSAVRKAMDASRDDIPLPGADWLADTLERLSEPLSAVPEERLLTETLKAGVGEVTLQGLEEELAGGDYLRARVDGVDYVTTPEARRKEREVVDFAKAGGIRLRRTKRGEAVATRAGEMLLPDADALPFDKLHEWVQKAREGEFTLVLHAQKARLYAGKAGRGEPMVFLEDLAGLPTGQARPRPASAVMAVAGKVLRRARQAAERMRYVLEREPEHAVDTRGVERSIGM